VFYSDVLKEMLIEYSFGCFVLTAECMNEVGLMMWKGHKSSSYDVEK
jgi:hypothetical protein